MSRKTLSPSAFSRLRAGDPFRYFQHAASTIKPGDRVVICARVSEHPQQLAGNLRDQERNLCAEMHRLGAHTVARHSRTWRGCDPVWLALAVDKARELDAKFLVFESVDRANRTEHFHPFQNPDAVAAEVDFDYLRYVTDGFPLLTLLPPDATPSEIKSYQCQRGQSLKGAKGGRPKRCAPGDKKALREAKLARVLRLHRLGESYRDISVWTQLPVMTVHGWIQKYG